jgi:hypothetical protein
MTQSPSPLPSEGAVVIAPEDARNPFVRMGVVYWRSLCGQRKFPARDQLTLRGMAPFMPYSVIIAVIDGGADYEFRYVGEAQRQAFKTYFKGMRVTQIEAAAPELGGVLRSVYEIVRFSGAPFAVRGRVDHEPPGSKFLYHETAFLPLGESDDAVDHLLIAGVQIPEPFWNIPEEKLVGLVEQVRPPAVAA